MRFSVSTASLIHFPLAWVFSTVKAAGFDGVELAVGWEVAVRGPAYVRSLEERFQLPVLSLHPPMLPVPGWRDARDKMVRTVRLAVALRSTLVTFHPPKAMMLGDSLAQRYLQSLEICRREAGHDTALAIENPVTVRGGRAVKLYAFDDPRDLRRFVEEQELPVTLDTSHAAFSTVGFWAAYELFKERLVNVHLSDVQPRRLPRPLGHLHTYVVQHQEPGLGVLPLAELLRNLRERGYAGLVTLEISPLASRALTKRRAVEALAHSLAFCRRHAGVISSHSFG